MELINTLYDEEAGLSAAALDQILPSLSLLLGPFAPYLAEELWEQLGRKGPVFRQPWPVYDEKLALADPKVQPFLEGKQVVKVIVVPDKLVNIVVK